MLLVSLLLLASRLWQVFLLLVASSKFLMVSRCWSLCYCWRSWCKEWCCWRYLSNNAVAGGPVVTVFPAVDGVLAVASVPAYPVVPILAGGFTYWIVGWDVLHHWTIGLWLSDCNFFLLYRTIGISNIILSNSRHYRTIGYRINASIYRTIGYRINASICRTIECRTQKKLSVAHPWFQPGGPVCLASANSFILKFTRFRSVWVAL